MIEEIPAKTVLFLREHYIWFSILIVLLAAVYWYVKYDVLRLGRIARSLGQITRKAEEIPGCVPENMKKIHRVFEREFHPVLENLWSAFYSDYRNVLREERIPDIREYFSVGGVMTLPGARKRVEAMPGLLLSLGVLGALGALVLRLTGMGQIQGLKVEQVMELLMKGASDAFIISIAAVAVSMVFQFSDRRVYEKALTELYRFQSLMVRKIPIGESHRDFGGLIAEQQKNTAAIREMGEVLALFSKAAAEVQEENIRKMSDAFLERLTASSQEVFSGMARNMTLLSETAVRTRGNLEAILREAESVAMVQKESVGSCSAAMKELAGSYGEVLEGNRQLMESFEKARILTGGLAEMLEMSGAILGRLNEQKQALQQESGEYLDRMESQLQRVHEDLSCRVEDILTRFADISENSSARLEGNLARMSEAFESNVKSMLESLDEQSRNLSIYAGELTADIGELKTALKDSVAEFGEHMHQGVERTFEDFDRGLAEISERLGKTALAIRDSVEALPAAMKVISRGLAGMEDKRHEKLG